ncbi:MAG: hypothetical protein AB200_00635 [Parcubacteria bacterium C7867-005]|nr:MAG: hypothetical protein AB200_00635 [Parcubacteria bacterium C7867-005]
MSKRGVVTILLIFISLAFPYWVYLPALFLTVLFLTFFWEAIFIGFIIDALYGSPWGGLLSYPVGLSVCLFLILLLPIRDRIRTNDA